MAPRASLAASTLWPASQQKEHRMPAYIIGHVTVINPDRYAHYMKATPEVIAKFGGKFIVRGGDKVTLEGEAETARVVILEFPSLERAQAFFNSTEYQQVKSLRQGAAIAHFMAIDGYEPIKN
jgi:uncharacterized protein (DUF1330 family)